MNNKNIDYYDIPAIKNKTRWLVFFTLDTRTYIRYNHKYKAERMFEIYDLAQKPLILTYERYFENLDMQIKHIRNNKFSNSATLNNRIGIPHLFY